MKAYIGNVDWADEGDIFFFSIETEERLKAMKRLLIICREKSLFYHNYFDIYWGTNEWFEFDVDDFFEFIDEAVDISIEEISIFRKFNVIGFDIYKEISDKINQALLTWDSKHNRINENLTKNDIEEIKPLFITLYGQERWDKANYGGEE